MLRGLAFAVFILTAVCAHGFVRERVYGPLGGVVYEGSLALVIVGEDIPGEHAFEATAQIWRNLLSSWRFPAANIRVVQARSSTDVYRAFTEAHKELTSEDRLIVAVVSHGKGGPDGPVLALRQDGEGDVPVNGVVEGFKGFNAKHKWLVLDACRSGDLKGIGPALGMTKDESAMAARSSAVALTSAPGRDAAVTPMGTKFALALSQSWDTLSKSGLPDGRFLSDVWHHLAGRLADAQMGRLGDDTSQMLLDPSLISQSSDPQEEYDEDSRTAVRKMILQLRSKLHVETDPVTLAWLKLQLAEALSQVHEPDQALADLTEAQAILKGLQNLSGSLEMGRQIRLARVEMRFAEIRDSAIHLAAARDLWIGLAEELDRNTPDWATAINGLGVAYHRLAAIESPVVNLKRSIDSYKLALSARTEAALPRQWAQTQNNLGAAHCFLAKFEDSGRNLQIATDYLKEAQRIWTEAAFPRDWAMAQDNRGLTYYRLSSIQDPVGNLTKAIATYKEALRIRTEDALPRDWATTQSNLGSAYVDLATLRAPRANLALAMELFTDAQRVWTEAAFPRDWADTQCSRGAAFLGMAKLEEPKPNLLRAMDCFTEAQRILTEAAFPRSWADAQDYRGHIYYQLASLEDPIGNLPKAIAAYQDALRIRKVEDLPRDWAKTQNNLGLAHLNLAKLREPKANLAMAMKYFTQAQRIWTEASFPRDWAVTEHNRGLSYAGLAEHGDRAGNLNKAIAAYRNGLRFQTEAADPESWAVMQVNLGLAHVSMSELGDTVNNLKRALESFVLAERGFRTAGDEGKAKKTREAQDAIRRVIGST